MAKKDSVEEDFLTCYICYEVFKEPKTLSCLHRFCENCLQNYINGQKSSLLSRQGGFRCPVCREMIRAPDIKRPPIEWAGLIKTDFYLNNLIRFIEQKREADTSIKKPNNPCSKHKDNSSDLFCVDCQKVICHLCAGIDHRTCNQVVTVSEAAADKRASSQVWLKKLDNVLSQSVSYDQTRAKYISNLEKQKDKTEANIKSWSEMLQSDIRKEEMNLLQNLNKQYKSMLDKIDTRVIHYQDKIKSLKLKLGNVSSNGASLSNVDILKMTNFIESGVIEDGESNLSMYKSFVDYLKRIEIVFERSSRPEVKLGTLVMRTYNDTSETPFTSTKTLEVSTDGVGSRVYDLDIPSSVLYSKDSSSKPSISVKRTASIATATAPTTSSSGSVVSRVREKLSRVLPKKPIPLPRHQSDSQREATQANETDETQPLPANYSQLPQPSGDSCDGGGSGGGGGGGVETVTRLRTINCVFRDDSDSPKLRDVLVASPGNTVLVTDWANQCVKAFFTRRDKDCRLSVGGKPWAITQLGDSITAVSLPLAKRICVLKVNSPLMVQKSFMVPKNYSGLATLNSQTLVASGGSDPPSVDIINLFGEVLKSFSLDQQGNPIFIYPAYVSVTPSAEILVSDKRRGAVVALSHSGNVRFEFSPQGSKQFQEPSGITTVRSGHILLLELRGLLRLTPRGQVDRPLLRQQNGEVNNAKGIAIDSNGLIYVTTNEEDVAVFEVSLTNS